jgi:hypothetical protein
MGRMVADAKRFLDHGGDPLGRPHVAQKPLGFGTLFQQAHQLGFLLGTQPGYPTGRHAMDQRLGASFARPLEPLTHRARRDAQRWRYRAAAPARLVQRPGAEPPPLVQLLARGGNTCAHPFRCTPPLPPFTTLRWDQ